MSETLHPIDLLPELALGVLPEAEARRIRTHLAACAGCREEFEALEAAASLLPLAADAPELPAGVRAAVLTAIRRETPPRTIRWRRPAFALAAAAALVGLALGALLTALVLPRNGGSDPRGEALLAAAARGEALRAAAAADGIAASLLVDPASGLAFAVLEGLPDPGPGRTYQAWLIGSAGPRSAGLIRSAGAYWLEPSPGNAAAAFAITSEPAGGSAAPTGDPLIIVPIGQAAARPVAR
ncbi:anti-sigma factor [Tepidiforma sp.]|uniref:anti-sigma factor n=1 Tax=Tepidiforma sp. TaxID=2682230 RepID=UPI002ADD7729|nr:anti-sigma factor [Tepidiforma sp.]